MTDFNETSYSAIPLRKTIEALVFASQKPITSKEIVAALKSATGFSDEETVVTFAKTKAVEVEEELRALQREYRTRGSGFILAEQATGWQVVSSEDCAVWVRQLFPELKPTRLSAPALETLAIIAYRQPITRADIEAVRGVAVDGVMNTLLDRGLVKIAGRADVPGRPLLYETTQHFLEHFGLKELEELPNADELRRIKLPTAPVKEEPKPDQAELPLSEETAGSDSEDMNASEQPEATASVNEAVSNQTPESEVTV